MRSPSTEKQAAIFRLISMWASVRKQGCLLSSGAFVHVGWGFREVLRAPGWKKAGKGNRSYQKHLASAGDRVTAAFTGHCFYCLLRGWQSGIPTRQLSPCAVVLLCLSDIFKGATPSAALAASVALTKKNKKITRVRAAI